MICAGYVFRHDVPIIVIGRTLCTSYPLAKRHCYDGAIYSASRQSFPRPIAFTRESSEHSLVHTSRVERKKARRLVTIGLFVGERIRRTDRVAPEHDDCKSKHNPLSLADNH